MSLLASRVTSQRTESLFLELVSSPLIFPLVRFRARTKRGFLYGVAFLGFLKGQHR